MQGREGLCDLERGYLNGGGDSSERNWSLASGSFEMIQSLGLYPQGSRCLVRTCCLLWRDGNQYRPKRPGFMNQGRERLAQGHFLRPELEMSVRLAQFVLGFLVFLSESSPFAFTKNYPQPQTPLPEFQASRCSASPLLLL